MMSQNCTDKSSAERNQFLHLVKQKETK